jgi:hypothetical protein
MKFFKRFFHMTKSVPIRRTHHTNDNFGISEDDICDLSNTVSRRNTKKQSDDCDVVVDCAIMLSDNINVPHCAFSVPPCDTNASTDVADTLLSNINAQTGTINTQGIESSVDIDPTCIVGCCGICCSSLPAIGGTIFTVLSVPVGLVIVGVCALGGCIYYVVTRCCKKPEDKM